MVIKYIGTIPSHPLPLHRFPKFTYHSLPLATHYPSNFYNRKIFWIVLVLFGNENVYYLNAFSDNNQR